MPWIIGSGLAMAAIAMVGGLFVLLPEGVLERAVRPLVAFAAGSLIGGALFHMLPHALHGAPDPMGPLGWVAVGFGAFFALDQLLEWHHCHRGPSAHVRPLGPLLLVADAVHNGLGGLAIGALMSLDLGGAARAAPGDGRLRGDRARGLLAEAGAGAQRRRRGPAVGRTPPGVARPRADATRWVPHAPQKAPRVSGYRDRSGSDCPGGACSGGRQRPTPR